MLDANGDVVQRLSFDAWGKRRDIAWTAITPANPFDYELAKRVNRGYTGHEELDPVGLVHMNGRVYDPEIGRFLSADPFVQDASNTQSFNAFAYVLNNPLSLTDPSGFFFGSLFKKIGHFFQSIARGFMSLARTIARSTIGRAILQIVACAMPGVNAIACAAVGAGLTLAAGLARPRRSRMRKSNMASRIKEQGRSRPRLEEPPFAVQIAAGSIGTRALGAHCKALTGNLPVRER